MMDTSDPAYGYCPSLSGAPHEYRLRPDGLGWRIGPRSGVVAYDAIRRVRLSYRPATLQPHRFVAEIWAEGAPKLQLSSMTVRSMMDTVRQDVAYSDFVMELHRRIAAAGAAATFESGKNPVVYWIGLVLFATVSLGLTVLVVRGLQAGSLGGATLVAGFLALFLWQIGTFFRRNRPRRYRAEVPPGDLLPR
jgi:hypothetical protein